MIGADISPRWQQGINWAAIPHGAPPGLEFVWIKVSDGGGAYDYQGEKARMVAGALGRGIPAGGYAYCQPESKGGTPEHQADVLAAECSRLNLRGITPMLDLEEAGTVSRSFGERAAKHLASLGWRPAVYMNSSSAKAIRPDQWDVPGMVIVIARYGNVPEAPGSAQYLGRYDVHQYADNGVRGGVRVDLDNSKNNSLLSATLGGEGTGDMAFTADDFQKFMWEYRFDDDGKGHTANFAQAVKTMRDQINALVELVKKGSNATGAEVAAALLPGLQDTVREMLVDVQGLDEQAVADRLATDLANRLAQ